MPAAARHRVLLTHPELGDWVGVVDACGDWLSLTPVSFSTGVLAAVPPADAAAAARAGAEFARWCATGAAPALAPEGTPFRRRVWAALAEIPRGASRSYGEIAGAVGCGSARAVGGAVGANPIGLFIPCHRVCGAGGAPTGYAWGLPLKRRILRMESGAGAA